MTTVKWPELPKHLINYFTDGYTPGSDDDHACFISIAEMQAHGRAYAKVALEAAAIEAWRTMMQNRSATPDDVAAVIRNLMED